jgi:hypothetical protein
MADRLRRYAFLSSCLRSPFGCGWIEAVGGCVVRIVRWFFICCAVLLCSGCSIWERETTNRGGYLDYLLDEHWIKADSKRMRALRAFALQVSLARIASVSSKNETDRQLMAIRLGATTKRALPVLACALDQNPLGGQNPCFYYDSAMVDYSTALFDLAMVALPIEDAKKLITAATGSLVNPINLLEVTQALVAIGKDALKYGRVVGALYRDTVELDVQVWIASPPIDPRLPPDRITTAHVTALADLYRSKRDDLAAWQTAIAALRGQGLEPWPDPRFFDQLASLMRYLCGLITTNTEALASCRSGLPESNLRTVSVLQQLSPWTIRSITAPAAARANTRIGDDPQQHGALSGRNEGYALILDPYDPKSQGDTLVRHVLTSLCVPGGEFDDLKNKHQVGPITDAQIAIYKATTGAPDGKKLDKTEVTAVRQLGRCGPGRGNNPFEKQTFVLAARPDAEAAMVELIGYLQKIDPSLKGDKTTKLDDLRDVIGKARKDPRVTSKPNLKKLPPVFEKQMTPDLHEILRRL